MAISTAVDVSAVARTVGIAVNFKDLRGGTVIYLPQRIALIGQGATASTYATTPVAVLSSKEVGDLAGYGSPIHLMSKLLFPDNGDGVGTIPVTAYPLVDDGAGVAATGDITATGTQTATKTYSVNVANQAAKFILETGDVVADAATAIANAINAIIEMPVIASAALGVVTITAKWMGETGNDIVLSIDGDLSGITFAFTQPTGGANNADIEDALNQIGNIWESIIINPNNYDDTTTLDSLSTFGEGRWLVKKPCFAVCGTNESTVATLTTAGDLRKADRTNVCIPDPECLALPFEIAARAVARIAKQANNNPPVDYAGNQLSGVDAGLPSDQFTENESDLLVKAGISTTKLIDGIVEMSDTVTFYHPDGETPPAYRYVVDIVKLQNLVFNFDLIFNSENWQGKVLIPDADVTVNKDARKPRDAKAAIFGLLDSAGLESWIVDIPTAKENTEVGISSTNPKRLDAAVTVQLSGNTNIISIDLNFGFYFGAQV